MNKISITIMAITIIMVSVSRTIEGLTGDILFWCACALIGTFWNREVI